jgi:hypothetical protein
VIRRIEWISLEKESRWLQQREIQFASLEREEIMEAERGDSIIIIVIGIIIIIIITNTWT